MKNMLSITIFSVILLLTGSSYAQSPELWGYNPQTGEHDKYLGNLNRNPYDPNSVNNPYGRYGNPYSGDSINNPYGRYGNPYSPYSPNNPYSRRQSPRIYGK